MRYFQQFDETDCGAACLAMIASHFGIMLQIASIRNDAGTDVDGTNLKGLIKAAEQYNLKARAVKGEHKAITSAIRTPFIAHLKIEFDEIHWTYHYVVVKHIGKKKIEIWDPRIHFKKRKKLVMKNFLNGGLVMLCFLSQM